MTSGLTIRIPPLLRANHAPESVSQIASIRGYQGLGTSHTVPLEDDEAALRERAINHIPRKPKREAEIQRVARFLKEPNVVTFTEWTAECRCGQLCTLDTGRTTYSFHNYGHHQERHCPLFKAQKQHAELNLAGAGAQHGKTRETTTKEEPMDVVADTILQHQPCLTTIPLPNLPQQESFAFPELEAAHSLLFCSTNDISFGSGATGASTTFSGETVTTDPSVLHDAGLLASFNQNFDPSVIHGARLLASLQENFARRHRKTAPLPRRRRSTRLANYGN